MNDKVKYWLEIAEYDLETAEAMLATKRLLYVGFMCHQSYEKLLKAYYAKVKSDTPPFTHNLKYLAEITSIIDEFDAKKLQLLNRLQPLNIEARYPTYKQEIMKLLTYDYCQSLISDSKEFYVWIKTKL
jgi:HEPN domain-containing protein